MLTGHTLAGLFYQDLLGASRSYVALGVVKEERVCSCVWAHCLPVYTCRYERYVFAERVDSVVGKSCCCKLVSWQPEQPSLTQRAFMSRSVGPLGFYTD